MKKNSLILIVLSLFLVSCTVSQSFTLSGKDGSSYTDLNIAPYFLDVLEDFSSFQSESEYSIMDEAMLTLSDNINNSAASSGVILSTDGESRRYILSFDYSSLEALISDINGGSSNTVLTSRENSFSLSLSMANYHELERMIPFLSDPEFEVYGPRYSNGMSEEEYMDMISFLLGEEAPEALSKSFVSLEIKTPGEITAVRGAMKTASNKAVFSFPVLDFLLLNEPLSFLVEWK